MCYLCQVLVNWFHVIWTHVNLSILSRSTQLERWGTGSFVGVVGGTRSMACAHGSALVSPLLPPPCFVGVVVSRNKWMLRFWWDSPHEQGLGFSLLCSLGTNARTHSLFVNQERLQLFHLIFRCFYMYYSSLHSLWLDCANVGCAFINTQTYAEVCWGMLRYAEVWWGMLTYADWRVFMT